MWLKGRVPVGSICLMSTRDASCRAVTTASSRRHTSSPRADVPNPDPRMAHSTFLDS